MFFLKFCFFLGALTGVHCLQVKFPVNRNFSNDVKIAGGNDAYDGQFPFQVSVGYQEGIFIYATCGGTIYSSLSIITSAQCCTNILHKPDIIIAGFYKALSSTGHEQQVLVSERIVHPDYKQDGNAHHNDICILRLKNKLVFDSYVSTIPIDKGENCKVNSVCTISGWGGEYSGSSFTSTLQFATIPILGDSECSNYGDEFISNEMTCAGSTQGDVGICAGDFGGPLACNNVLCGVSSLSRGCADRGYPGVFTKVSNYVEWIEQNSPEQNSSVQCSGLNILIILSFTLISKFLL